jgi:ribonuclease HI
VDAWLETQWLENSSEKARHQVIWTWVKGHAGHPENEAADALARAGMAPFKP